jgi:orotidine-5'-phosphate decarboxylase
MICASAVSLPTFSAFIEQAEVIEEAQSDMPIIPPGVRPNIGATKKVHKKLDFRPWRNVNYYLC